MPRKMNFCFTLAIALLSLTSLTVTARAQNIFGAIVGTVTDPSNAVLAGISVTATNLGTGEIRTVTTDEQGNYQILSLSRGDYKIEVDAPGFKHFSRSPVDVVVNQQARVNVQMVI